MPFIHPGLPAGNKFYTPNKERERFSFPPLDLWRSPLSEVDMSLRLRGGSIYADH